MLRALGAGRRSTKWSASGCLESQRLWVTEFRVQASTAFATVAGAVAYAAGLVASPCAAGSFVAMTATRRRVVVARAIV